MGAVKAGSKASVRRRRRMLQTVSHDATHCLLVAP